MTNAKFYRNFVCAGLGALALSHVPLSHAFYGSVTPPAGYSIGANAVAAYNSASAATAASIQLGKISANASLNVAGRAVSIPATMRIGAGAARVAAAAIYLHPGLRVAAQVAAWTGAAGLLYDAAQGWGQPDPEAAKSDGFEYRISSAYPWSSDPVGLCKTYSQRYNLDYSKVVSTEFYDGYKCFVVTELTKGWDGYPVGRQFNYRHDFEKRASNCPTGWYSTPAGCVQTQPFKPANEEEFMRELQKHLMPDGIPNVVWPATWPVEAPAIAPTFVPTGNPVPNPKYDPSKPQSAENQPYVQPGVKVTPAPTADSPWQVDIQPVDRPVASPEAKPNPVPETNPDGTPKPDQGDKPKEDKDERDLCEKNPDILACQKIDTEVEDAEIPKAQKTVSYQAENIWGGGSCPADKYTRVGGQQMKVSDWSRDCQFITDSVKPVAIVISLLIVAGILLGALKP